MRSIIATLYGEVVFASLAAARTALGTKLDRWRRVP